MEYLFTVINYYLYFFILEGKLEAELPDRKNGASSRAFQMGARLSVVLVGRLRSFCTFFAR